MWVPLDSSLILRLSMHNKRCIWCMDCQWLSVSSYKFADCIVLIVLFVYWFVSLCCSSSWRVVGPYVAFLLRSCLIIIATIVDVVVADHQLWLMYWYSNQLCCSGCCLPISIVFKDKRGYFPLYQTLQGLIIFQFKVKKGLLLEHLSVCVCVCVCVWVALLLFIC